MRILLEIALNDLRLFLTNRGNLIGLLVIPIVMTLVIGIFTSGDGGPTQLLVDVIDHDESDLSEQFVDTLRSVNDSLVLCPMDNTEEDVCELSEVGALDRDGGIARVGDSVTQGLVEIEKGFGEGVRASEMAAVLFWTREDFTAPNLVQKAVEAAIQRVNGASVASLTASKVVAAADLPDPEERDPQSFKDSVYDRASEMWESEPARVSFELTAGEEPGAGSNIQEGLGQSVPGMGSMFVMFTVLGGITVLVGERSQWTLQRLASMPISRAQLLGGKIIARFLLGILQFLVVFAVGVIAALNFGDDFLALVVVMISYTLAVTALSFAIGTRVRNETQASGLSLLLSITLAPLGGAWWPLEVVPETMRIIGHISPVAWAMDGFNALIFERGGLAEVLLPSGVLLGLAVVFFAIAIWRFRYD
jgi:ABC-2 type transport system permease protein